MTKALRTIMVPLCFAALLSATSTAAAADLKAPPTQPPSALSESLATYLDADGSLALPEGFTGSLDPKGFRMVQGRGEKPRFVPESVAGAKLFGVPGGCNAPVNAIAVAPSGLIYLGGAFTVCEDVPAAHVVSYDPLTRRFQALGSGGGNGLDFWVYALAVSGTDLYVGGLFTKAGGLPAKNVARWNGSAWSSLGSGASNGVSARVLSLAVAGSDLYVGGLFLQAGGQPANRIARWNGSVWSTLGSGADIGVDNTVRAIAVAGSDLYVGGDFSQAGGQPANHIARWNGSAWSSLGSGASNGVSSPVSALAVSASDLFVGGSFDLAGGQPANGIARWNGSTWSSLGSGAGNGVNGGSAITTVFALTVSGADLYVGGDFSQAGGQPANRIARWDGSAWSAFGSGAGNGLNHWVYAIAVSGSDLFIGGFFRQAGGQPANFIVRWDGSAWSSLGNGAGDGVNGTVRALAVLGSDLYVGGSFTEAGGQPANGIARWNGSAWSSLGLGTGSVLALAVSGSDLYVGGTFRQAGGQPADRIARWNGSAWSSLGSGAGNGVGGTVYALAVAGSDLYVGGDYTQAGGQSANRIARWNGSAWSSLGSGAANGVNDQVRAMAVSSSDLYVGGFFTQAGGQSANRIARWNGSAWSALGSGVSGGSSPSVDALAVSGSDLYVGGFFFEVDGQPANAIARWNGGAWSTLGSGASNGINQGFVQALAVSGNDLYVGGFILQAGGQPANGLARWDGSEWEGMATDEPQQIVLALTSDATSLYVGGSGLTQSPLPELQTRALNGRTADAASASARTSRSGGRVVFSSRASDLVAAGDTFSDIYLRDAATGEILRISQPTPTAKGIAREEFFAPSIAPTGNTIAYSGTSGQVFANFAGIGRTASTSRGGTPGNGESGRPMVPGAGSAVLYDSTSTNLLDTPDGNGSIRDIVAKDLNTGAVSLITVGPTGQPANGGSFGPWATDDGQTVAFWSLATNLSDVTVNGTDTAKSGTIKQVLVSGLQGVGRSATLVSRNLATGQLGNGDSINVRLTPDGRFGVFESVASNLVDDDTNGVSDIFRFELETVGNRLQLANIERVSLSRYGFQGNGPSFNPSISDDGQFITFQTDATNLIELDRNDATDILVKWLVTKEVVRLSRTVNGEQPNGDSIEPTISGDGSTIVYGSAASNLTENDDNGVDDIFAVRIRESGGPAIVDGITNYSYTYWNPNEPGWGYNLQHQGDLLYGTWYTYAEDGQVMFLTVEATAQSASTFAGPVFRVAGTPFSEINGSQAFTSVTQVGTAQMSFAADSTLTLSYTVNGVPQVKALEKFIFASTAPTCVGTTDSRATATNYSDLWWNATEPGWGLTLAHQGDTVFALWYTYGAAGRDQWISASSLVRQPDGSYTGALQRPQNGTPLTQINGPATSFPVPGVGNATLRFTNGETGSFSYTLDGVSQTKPIQRFVVVAENASKPLCTGSQSLTGITVDINFAQRPESFTDPLLANDGRYLAWALFDSDNNPETGCDLGDGGADVALIAQTSASPSGFVDLSGLTCQGWISSDGCSFNTQLEAFPCSATVGQGNTLTLVATGLPEPFRSMRPGSPTYTFALIENGSSSVSEICGAAPLGTGQSTEVCRGLDVAGEDVFGQTTKQRVRIQSFSTQVETGPDLP